MVVAGSVALGFVAAIAGCSFLENPALTTPRWQAPPVQAILCATFKGP
jgi:hypothetical protein